MQALGAYDGGRMLFLGLGTGLGSALISESVIVPLELGSLPYRDGKRLVEHLGRDGRERNGHERWLAILEETTAALRRAFSADYVMLGGGKAKLVDPLPPNARRGGNEDAFEGGFRLWEQMVEPPDRQPAPVWRVVR
jgi:polyphosphate glucokinase